ncbi:hypothetical protein CH063_09788 [Colletotrichum higginsianum]|uniref:Uncharacterized protein n=2 Tax=Colletotrichum higginsianum TaxID=80884 RepID=H1VEY0_COLHI|nr:hypothetical protein CH63R_05287 [Colletotrichum higginsianum IMI 349063]OBR12991.1 hypothetical protein CH63R_05287 [Colletotrichum higginsianum IMI 349063]TID00181.1 hypothetical protein CH35J_004944 [Colletotrichum higginsianum]CCF38783.1 hypothetical protein CH063_09788 [Colletotrichum higginsianum]
MSNPQGPQVAGKDYNPSVFSQDTLVGSDANSVHPLLTRNVDGTTTTTTTTSPLRGTDPQPSASDNFHYVSTRVVKEIPKAKTPSDPKSPLGRLKNLLKPPVVKAVEALPSHEGKSYHVNEQGQIIETTTRRAGECGCERWFHWCGRDI